jgi:hypothetical protein
MTVARIDHAGVSVRPHGRTPFAVNTDILATIGQRGNVTS